MLLETRQLKILRLNQSITAIQIRSAHAYGLVVQRCARVLQKLSLTRESQIG
jgi:hypothetical protein